jgi:hypothetical protein
MFETVVEVGIGYVFPDCIIVCALLSCCVLQKVIVVNESDTQISYLPLAHMFEQMMLVSVDADRHPHRHFLSSILTMAEIIRI